MKKISIISSLVMIISGISISIIVFERSVVEYLILVYVLSGLIFTGLVVNFICRLHQVMKAKEGLKNHKNND